MIPLLARNSLDGPPGETRGNTLTQEIVSMSIRTLSIRTLLILALWLVVPALSGATEVVFDAPDAIECRDVTPAEFAPCIRCRK